MTSDDLDLLRETIRMGMNAFVPNPNGPDYCCIYCGAEPIGGQHNPITHRPDCLGARSLVILLQESNTSRKKKHKR